LFRPRERAFKQFKCPRPQCVNTAKCVSVYMQRQKVPSNTEV